MGLVGERRPLGPRALLAATALSLLAAAPAAGLNPRRVVIPALPGSPTYACVGSPITLFDNSNTQGVSNGATPATFSTHGRAYCLSSMTTYHWNDGQGQAPGSLALSVVSGIGGRGQTIGPYPAVGSAGQGGAPDVNWTASTYRPIVINGVYGCSDSSPSTWSQNQASGGHGFCTVIVTRAVVTRTPRPAKPTYACIGSQLKLFDNTNVFGVVNGGRRQAWNTYVQQPGVFTYCLNSITTYHWNAGAGVAPGKLGLGPLDFAALQHPVPYRHASSSSGQGGARNVNWYINYSPKHPVVIGGSYYCSDSSPATWSSNQQSKGSGFCTVYGTPAYVTSYAFPGGRVPIAPPSGSGGPPPKPKQGKIKCFTGTLSSMLLYPIHIPAGGSGLILLQCGIKLKDGFRGSLAPSSVFVIEFGCTSFWTYPSQSGGAVTPYLQYTGPPNGTCKTAKTPVPWSVTGPWRIDYETVNAATGAPLTPGSYAVFVESARGDSSAQNNLTVQ